MAYGRYRRNLYYTDWHDYHATKRERVARLYGGIDENVLKAFFHLDPLTLESFFNHYRANYGNSAGAYARKTYSAWKSGKTLPSGQTSERLLEGLPPFLSLQTKCDLLQKLREHYRDPESHELVVSTSSWRETIKPLVDHIIHRAYTATLPQEVTDRLKWLSARSMQAAGELLVESETQAAKHAASFLDLEFQNIERLLITPPFGKKVFHQIELPYGTIKVTIKRSSKMEKNDHPRDLVTTGGVPGPTAADLLKNAAAQLDKEQIKRLAQTAADQALSLEVEKSRAEQRALNSTRDMDSFIDNARNLGRQNTDFGMKGSFDGASGRTDVEVSKRTSMVTLAIAVVIGIVLLLLFLSRH